MTTPRVVDEAAGEKQRTEYRVLGTFPATSLLRERTFNARCNSDKLSVAQERVQAEAARGAFDLRIQSRTVTETPWTDLKPEECS